MVCGPGRAGKSSLIDSLRNKPISKKKDSTPGVSLSKATCHITEDDGQCHWPKETDDREHQQLFLMESLGSASRSASNVATSSENSAATRSPAQSNVQPRQGSTSQQPSTGQRSAAVDKRAAPKPIEHKTIEECSKRLNMIRQQQVNARRKQPRRQKLHFLDIWDFGGQQAYAFLQHMLLSDGRCQYLIAFNGSIAMDAVVPPETFGIDGVEHAVVDLRGQQTYGEVLISWLDVIYQTVGKRGCVRLIGTHLDKVRCPKRVSFQSYRKTYQHSAKRLCISLLFVFRESMHSGISWSGIRMHASRLQ